MERIIIKTFKNLKEIKNRDEYVKICEMNYGNTFLKVIGQNERIVRMLPTEIINMNLENRFTDIRGLTQSDKVILIEGQTGSLSRPDLERYYGYHRDSYCKFSKEIKTVIVCLSNNHNLKKIMAEENICFTPLVVELKKFDGNKYLNRLRKKFKNNVELDSEDCALLVHLPLFMLDISQKEYVYEICECIRDCQNIPESEKSIIIPAMYLNIEQYVEEEYEQEKLLEMINMLKYCENELDRKIRLAREDEAQKVTEIVTKRVTEAVTKRVTEAVTKEVTKKVTEQLTNDFACNLLRNDSDEGYVQKITGLDIQKIRALKANL